MSKIDHYKKKFLGFMTPDQINEVKITNRGFVYKGNLIVAIPNLTSEVEKVIEPIVVQAEEIEKIEVEDYISHVRDDDKGTLVTELPKGEDLVIQTEEKKIVIKEVTKKINNRKKK